MAEQPLKSFNLPLMRVSLFNSILVTLILYQEQSEGWLIHRLMNQLDRN